MWRFWAAQLLGQEVKDTIKESNQGAGSKGLTRIVAVDDHNVHIQLRVSSKLEL